MNTENTPIRQSNLQYFQDLNVKRRQLEKEISACIGKKLFDFVTENGVNLDKIEVSFEPLFSQSQSDPIDFFVYTKIGVKL